MILEKRKGSGFLLSLLRIQIFLSEEWAD